MSWENIACCDHCWVRREADRIPHRFTSPRQEACHFCGKPTISGIYVRVNIDEEPAASLRLRKEIT